MREMFGCDYSGDMGRKAVFIAGLLFGLMALIHLWRLLHPFVVKIGSFTAPVWLSGVFYVIGGCISAYLFRAYRNLKSKVSDQ